MKLKLLDRIILKGLLRTEGSFIDLTIRKDLVEKIDISQEEIKEFEIKTVGNSLEWSTEASEKEFEYDLTDLETNAVVEQLKKLDKEEKLSSDHMNLYALFVK